MSAEERVFFSRRKALDYILGGGIFAFLASLIYPAFRFLFPTKLKAISVGSILIGKVSDLKPNSAKLFRFGNEVGIIVRKPAGDFAAFNAKCTHLSCTVQYRPDLEHIWCACHNGHFDLIGRNIEGPPPRPLTPFTVRVERDKVFVSKKV